MSLSAKTVLLAGCLGAAAMAALPAPAAAKDQPPSCAAISFRPLAPNMPDGVHEAGMYRSRFARMELMGQVEGGAPRDYFLQVNGKRMEGSIAIPKGVEGCLKGKHVKVPVVKMEGGCVGNRYRVVIHNAGKQKLAMLFTLKGDDWNLCSAANI